LCRQHQLSLKPTSASGLAADFGYFLAMAQACPGVNVMIIKTFSPKQLASTSAVYVKNTAFFSKIGS
jgi:hypothetical protein